MNSKQMNEAIDQVAAAIDRDLEEMEIPRDPPDPSACVEAASEPTAMLEEPAYATDCPACGGPVLMSDDGDIVGNGSDTVSRRVGRA